MVNVTKKIPIIFNAKPALAISGIRKYPEPNTTAFGGVATGNMNAHDATTAAATINLYGWNPNATAHEAIIVNINEAVTAFDVNQIIVLQSSLINLTQRIQTQSLVLHRIIVKYPKVTLPLSPNLVNDRPLY